MRDSLIFYSSFSKAIKRLPENQQLKALWAIIDYGLEGEEPEDNGELYMSIYEMAKPQIDANIKRKANGAKGGRPAEDIPEEENGPVVGAFKLNDGTFYEVTKTALDKMQKLYPGVECDQELNKIIGWCDSNPTRRKTRKGAPRFLNSWFAREQDKSAKSGKSQTKKQNAFFNYDQRDTDYDSIMQDKVKEWMDNDMSQG